MAIVIVRTLIVYLTLLVIMRLMGKRQLGEMELSEFIVAALIADMAAHPLQDIGIPMINGLVPVLVLFCCEVLISGLSMKSIALRSLLFGRPSILIEKGRIRQNELRKNRFTLDELMQQLRNQSVTDISQVEYAILETDGRLNVLLYPDKQPMSPSVLGISLPSGAYPVLVINNGRVLGQNLRLMGKNERWLASELKKRGCTSVRSVFCMSLDREGRIYFAPMEEK